jgi:hypothetical protein
LGKPKEKNENRLFTLKAAKAVGEDTKPIKFPGEESERTQRELKENSKRTQRELKENSKRTQRELKENSKRTQRT